MNKEDLLSFMDDLQPYLEGWDVEELEKSGVRVPLRDHMDFYDWTGLCYVCLWVLLRDGDLPLNLRTRMVLGETNQFSQMVIQHLEGKDASSDAGG